MKRPIAIPTLLFFSLIAFVASFIVQFGKLPPQIPLFYSLAEGEGIIVDIGWIFIIPLVLIVIVLLNMLVSRKYYRSNVFIENIIYWANVLLIVSLTAIYLKIIFLVS